MTRDEFIKKLEANGFEKVSVDIWRMREQPPEPWARTGACIRGDRYDSLVYFRNGGCGVSERGLRFEQSKALFSRPWETE